MAVRYDLFLKDGRHVKIFYACFGLLNSLPIGRYNVSGSLYNTDAQYDAAKDTSSQTQPQNVSFVQYLPESNFYTAGWSCPNGNPSRTTVKLDGEFDSAAKARAMKEYFKEMTLLLKDMPMLDGLVTIHPLAKAVRVHVKDQPADKVALALFLFRNLAQDDYVHGYRKLRQLGYRPRLAAIITHAVQYSPANTSGFNNYERWYGRCQDENSWVNPITFGRNGFLKMAKQEELDVWFQPNFQQTSRGYLRDHHYEEENEIFNEDADSDDEDSGYHRSLNDVFSVPDDVKLHISQRHGSRGFYWNDMPDDVLGEIFEPLILESGVAKSI